MQRFVVPRSAWQKTILAVAVAPWCLAAAPGSVGVEIEYTSSPGCGGAQQFWLALQRRMPRVRVAARGQGDISLTVHLIQIGHDVQGHLRLRELPDHEEMDLREVMGTGCDEVVEALALTAALAIEQREAEEDGSSSPTEGESGPVAAPSTGDSTTAAKVQPPGASETPTKLGDDSVAPVAKNARAQPRTSTVIGAHAFATQIVAPTVSLGLGIDARSSFLLSSEWRPTFGLSVLYAPSELLQPESDVAVGWAAAAAQACPKTWRVSDWVAVAPCAAGSVGWVSVTGTASNDPLSVRRLWWGLGGLARVEFRVLSRTSLDLATELQVPVFAREFVTTQPRQTVAATPVMAWRAALGVAHRFQD